MVRRYLCPKVYSCLGLESWEYGEWVLYEDHAAAIAAKEEEIERLKDENRLLTGVIDDHRRMSQEALSDEAFTLLPLDALRRIAGECSE